MLAAMRSMKPALSESYKSTLKNVLLSFADNIRSTHDISLISKKYSLFCPLIGKNYFDSNEVVIFGQATNGWCPNWFIKDIPKQAEIIVSESIGYSTADDGKCPLEWVNEQWNESCLFRSFFWNVIYKLVKTKYNRADSDWNNIICWSNLIKIAPSDSGNPNYEEIQAQLIDCSILFRKELDDLRPKNVLVITNLEKWAEPILRTAKIEVEKKAGNYIQAIGRHNNSKIIVTRRPYIGPHLPFVEELCKELV